MGDDPVWASSNPEHPGFLLEIVLEMTKYLNLEPVKDFLPWRRAQFETITADDGVVIFPLARTEARENKYKWLCKLFDIPVAFITTEGGMLINSYEEAAVLKSNQRFGVLLGTPQERRLRYMAEKKGIELNFAALKHKKMYKLLYNKRVPFIYGGIPEALAAWEVDGYSASTKLIWGKSLQVLPLWIATSKKSKRLKPEDWQRALAKVKASGFYDKTLQRHFKNLEITN
ncbi:amino acid ABC transporter substrate-binding protein [Piscirickettsiaceae bacterium NZ-RLO2]|nr:amino acid ABC transporter substrate-binding protein [Piscirickettsiaceae bacterium NZ-RLO2]